MRATRFILPLVAFGLLAVVLAIGIKRSPDKGLIVSPLLGKPAPQFSLPTLNAGDRHVGTADLKGQWYVFNVWATWCYACREEHAMLLEAQKDNVAPLIGMDWNDQDDLARQYLAQLGNPYEFVLADRDGRTAINWGVYGAPETFLVNPDGVVVYKHVGALTREVWEREFVSRLPPKAGKS
jgi:cytochrome c biogenesis protein CcmG/thiol:disulfide interchange protein DsbE